MSLLTLLEKAGHDVNQGIKLVLPYSIVASSIIGLVFPGLGPAIGAAFIAVTMAENHFSTLPKSGPQKLAYAMTIAGPILAKYCPDGMAIESILSKIADGLNAVDETGAAIPAVTGIVQNIMSQPSGPETPVKP